MRTMIYSLLVALLFSVLPAHAQNDNAEVKNIELKNDPYFVALINIRMKKKQTERFKKYMNEYAMNRGKVVDREKRKNQAQLPRRVKNGQLKIRKKFISKMSRLLDDDQFSRFPAFHAELDKLLAKRESLTEESDPDNLVPGI